MNDINEKVRTACHRIEELWYETGGKCYVSFSGGKDSTVLLALIKLCQELYTVGDIPAVFSNTGIELGVTVDFVKWCKASGWYPSVQIIHPEVSFDWVLKNKGKPMKSKMKSEMIQRWHKGIRTRSLMQHMIYGKTNSGKKTWILKLGDQDMHMLHDDFPIMVSNECCKHLKKTPFKTYAKANNMNGQITGIRMGEGGTRELNAITRSKKEGARICTTVNGKGFIKKTPLIDWTDEDVDEFIKHYNVPLSDAYTKYGFQRTGCMACPYAFKWLPHNLQYLYYHEPNRYKASMHWLKDVYIAQNVVLPFDEAYERERLTTWQNVYEPMRQEMLRKYRPNSKLIKEDEQLSLFGVEIER